MTHDWILSVLADLRDYARVNGLATVAGKAEEALATARTELAERRPPSPCPRPRPLDTARN